MRTWWRRWNELMTGEQLPDEPHEPLSGFYAGQKITPAHEPAGS
jgi:hypothetical protein